MGIRYKFSYLHRLWLLYSFALIAVGITHACNTMSSFYRNSQRCFWLPSKYTKCIRMNGTLHAEMSKLKPLSLSMKQCQSIVENAVQKFILCSSLKHFSARNARQISSWKKDVIFLKMVYHHRNWIHIFVNKRTFRRK